MSPRRSSAPTVFAAAAVAGFALSAERHAHGYGVSLSAASDDSTVATAITTGVVGGAALIAVTVTVTLVRAAKKKRARDKRYNTIIYDRIAELDAEQRATIATAPPEASVDAYWLLRGALISVRSDLTLELGLLVTSPAAFDRLDNEIEAGEGPALEAVAAAAGVDTTRISESWQTALSTHGRPSSEDETTRFTVTFIEALAPSLDASDRLLADLLEELVDEQLQPDFPADAPTHAWLAEALGVDPLATNATVEGALSETLEAARDGGDVDPLVDLRADPEPAFRTLTDAFAREHAAALQARMESLEAQMSSWMPAAPRVDATGVPDGRMPDKKSVAVTETAMKGAFGYQQRRAFKEAVRMFEHGWGDAEVLEAFFIASLDSRVHPHTRALAALERSGTQLEPILPMLTYRTASVRSRAQRAFVAIARRTGQAEQGVELLEAALPTAKPAGPIRQALEALQEQDADPEP